MPQKKQRAVIKIDYNNFINYAGRLANANLVQGQASALQMIQDCLYFQKGQEKRKLTLEEAGKHLSKTF